MIHILTTWTKSRHQKPTQTINNQQPTINNQQSTTNNHQPTIINHPKTNQQSPTNNHPSFKNQPTITNQQSSIIQKPTNNHQPTIIHHPKPNQDTASACRSIFKSLGGSLEPMQRARTWEAGRFGRASDATVGPGDSHLDPTWILPSLLGGSPQLMSS